MSVLGGPDEPYLRYAHVPGLIMRHDKHAFAGEAIRTAAAGKVVGDYERMLLFSHYAGALPWPIEETHSCLDPFTGCFVLALPFTTALLCLALKALSLSGGERRPATGFIRTSFSGWEHAGSGPCWKGTKKTREWMERSYDTERRAWHAYYDILDRVEEEAQKQSV